MSENLEKSELVIARILDKLIEYGFQHSTLNLEEIELDDSYSSFWITCCDWLIDEGIIRVSDHTKYIAGSSILQNPVLTAYGISLLGRTIGPVDDARNLQSAVKEVSSTRVSYASAGELFGGLLGAFAKSIGS